MSNVSWGFIFVPPGLVLTLWLLRKLFPPPAKVEKPTSRPSPSSKEKKAYQNYDGYSIGLLFFFWPVTTISLTWLFSRLGTLWNANRFSEATFVLNASWVPYLFPAIFPGLLITGYIADRALRVIIGNRIYQEYQEYSNRRIGINWEPLIRPFIIIVMLTTIITWYMVINWYVLFTPEHIVIKPFFSMTAITRQYSDIESIRTAPAWIWVHRKEIVPIRQYIIRFRNGDKWITVGGFNFPKTFGSPARLSSGQMAQILGYVSRQAGVPIIEMKVLNPFEP